MNFWESLWLIVWFVLLLSYITVLFAVVRDVVADPVRSGGVKALWIIGLLFFPLLGSLAYLLFNGRSMALRQDAREDAAKEEFATAIREIAGTAPTPAEQIARAKSLLDSGTVTKEEFELLKERALINSAP